MACIFSNLCNFLQNWVMLVINIFSSTTRQWTCMDLYSSTTTKNCFSPLNLDTFCHPPQSLKWLLITCRFFNFFLQDLKQRWKDISSSDILHFVLLSYFFLICVFIWLWFFLMRSGPTYYFAYLNELRIMLHSYSTYHKIQILIISICFGAEIVYDLFGAILLSLIHELKKRASTL